MILTSGWLACNIANLWDEEILSNKCQSESARLFIFIVHFIVLLFTPNLQLPHLRNFRVHNAVSGHQRAAKKPSTDGVSLDYFLSELSDDDCSSW